MVLRLVSVAGFLLLTTAGCFVPVQEGLQPAGSVVNKGSFLLDVQPSEVDLERPIGEQRKGTEIGEFIWIICLPSFNWHPEVRSQGKVPELGHSCLSSSSPCSSLFMRGCLLPRDPTAPAFSLVMKTLSTMMESTDDGLWSLWDAHTRVYMPLSVCSIPSLETHVPLSAMLCPETDALHWE